MTDLFEDIDTFLKDNPEPREDGVLKQDEYETIIMSFATARGEDGFTEEETVKIVRWAESTRIAAILLEEVLAANVLVDLKDDEPVFTLTDRGRMQLADNTEG